MTPSATLVECFCARVWGSSDPSRTAAIGGTRVARLAGSDAREQRDDRAQEERDDDRARLDDRPGVGEVDAERDEQGVHALGDADAEDQPDERGQQADHEAFDLHRAQDLLARGAEGPQGGELAGPLGDRDRQGVEDHERAHEQRDAAEAEQEDPDEAEALVRLLGGLRGLVRGKLDVGVGGRELLHGARAAAAGAVPSFAVIEIESYWPS